jgi:hypothetical protein
VAIPTIATEDNASATTRSDRRNARNSTILIPSYTHSFLNTPVARQVLGARTNIAAGYATCGVQDAMRQRKVNPAVIPRPFDGKKEAVSPHCRRGS